MSSEFEKARANRKWLIEHEKIYCPKCGIRRDFVFHGEQYFDKVRMYDLYNCSTCGDTIAFNPSKEWMARLRKSKLEWKARDGR